MSVMKVQEVAALLGKSDRQIRRYINEGLLQCTQNGRELLFDRDAVLEFARSRGIRTNESGVPEGPNFTDSRQAQEYLQNFLADGAELLLKGKPATVRV